MHPQSSQQKAEKQEGGKGAIVFLHFYFITDHFGRTLLLFDNFPFASLGA